jgi:RNA polymerase sigma factor (sigma-70 family)
MNSQVPGGDQSPRASRGDKSPRGVTSILGFLQRLRFGGSLADDVGLLRAYLAGDDAAFTLLVQRHGPLVWGVCWRMLQQDHDAEEAFQATFIVLARKAGSLGESEPLGPWLYRVAQRTANKARLRRNKRQARQLSEVTDLAGGGQEPNADLQEVIDEEVERLPELFRRAFILCQLEGLTNEEAAKQLGCPVGTIQSRLSRAKERLRLQLSRRGVGPGAVLPVLSALPPSVAQGLIEFAPALRMGTLSLFSTNVAELATGVLSDMMIRKFSLLAVTTLILVCVASGAGLFGNGQGSGNEGGTEPATARKDTAAPKKDKPEPKIAPGGNTGTKKQKTPIENAGADFRANPTLSGLLRLMNTRTNWAGVEKGDKATLEEVAQQLSRPAGFPIVFNERALANEDLKFSAPLFEANGMPPMNAPIRTILQRLLASHPSGVLRFIIRDLEIEITTEAAIRQEFGFEEEILPFIHGDYQHSSMLEILEDLQKQTSFNILVDPSQTEKVVKQNLSAKMMNMPIDVALKFIAEMGEMGVVREANTFYVTTKAKAKELQQTQKPKAGG